MKPEYCLRRVNKTFIKIRQNKITAKIYVKQQQNYKRVDN